VLVLQKAAMARIRVDEHGSKKAMIVQQAVTLFKTKGFARASMRHLAEAMGIEAPSLYNHIGSKNELLQEICFTMAAIYTGQLDEVEARDITIPTKLKEVIRFHIRQMLNNADEVHVANHEWRHLPEPYLAQYLQYRRQYEKRLVALVETGIQNGEFKPIHPHIAVLTILSAVRGLEFWHRQKYPVAPATIEATILQQLLNGLIL
jgi:TetR/AcrR family transcriptional regulator, cholesterol catabolism regulator